MYVSCFFDELQPGGTRVAITSARASRALLSARGAGDCEALDPPKVHRNRDAVSPLRCETIGYLSANRAGNHETESPWDRCAGSSPADKRAAGCLERPAVSEKKGARHSTV